MRVTLVHNPTAGHDWFSKEHLVGVLRAAGYEPEYVSARSVRGEALSEALSEALREPGELVVVAGGDGTVQRVTHHLVGRSVPIGILPVGTANNLARAHGWKGRPEEIVGAWTKARQRPFDMGVAEGLWGAALFSEAAGVGLFPYVMPRLEARKEREIPSFETPAEELAYDLRGLLEASRAVPARPWRVTLDGEDLSGDYFLIEAMNTETFGPGLRLAPHADPRDGLLDVVLLAEEHRDAFAAYVAGCMEERETLLEVPVRRGKRLELRPEGRATLQEDAALHADSEMQASQDAAQPVFGEDALDGDALDKDTDARRAARLRLRPGALTFLAAR